jgi:hypothetical protein
MATQTDIQESAQALFCALADFHGSVNIDKVFNTKIYPTYFQFKMMWDKKYPANKIEKSFNTHVKSGKASFEQIETLLHGDSKKSEWYISSVLIANKLIKDISKISNKFQYIKSSDWSSVFYAHGDPEVMTKIAKLYTNANKTQDRLYKDDKSTPKKVQRKFQDINKWSTADIYFASDIAKKNIDELLTKKIITFLDLNRMVGQMITEGQLLPLSLKKVKDKVKIDKVNFNRPKEERLINTLAFGGFSNWKPFNSKVDDINKYTRTMILYMTTDKRLTMQLRHDPSAEGYKGVIQYAGAGAFEGSLSAGPISKIMEEIDATKARTWFTKYQDANEEFRKVKEELDKTLKTANRKKYDEEREKASAEVTNIVNPELMKFLSKKENADTFVKLVFVYTTARSELSSKYVIAK